MTKGTKRLLAALLCLALCVSLLPLPAMAEAGTISAAEEGTITMAGESGSIAEPGSVSKEDIENAGGPEPKDGELIREEVYINPLYADVFTEEDLTEPKGGGRKRAAGEVYATAEEAGAYARERLLIREESISVPVVKAVYEDDPSGFLKNIFHVAMEHTGVPTEGDYLLWQYVGWKGSAVLSSGNVLITYTVTYYTSYEQELEMDRAVADLLDSLQTTEKGTYDTICTLYNWITEHVTYDYDTLDDDDYKLKYTAYAALINGTAVCQGYSVLLYRLLLECGIDCRVITGKGNGEAHAWNIIRIEGLYYNADSTWDTGKSAYRYFLVCDANFARHVRGDDYSTGSFYEAYPMDDVDYDALFVVWEWEADHSAALARVYDRTGAWLDTVPAVVSESTTPGCEKPGVLRHIAQAEYRDITFTSVSKESIPPSGHTPGEPAWENVEQTSSGEASYDEVIRCAVCGDMLDSTFHTIRLDITELTMPFGASEQLTVFDTRYGYEVTPAWNSSDDEIASVSPDGVVTANKVGTAVVTATVNGVELTCEVMVQFTDVTDPGEFYYDYVYVMTDGGIVGGYDDGTFRPMGNCNRAAVVTFLWRLAGEPEATSRATFKDMTDNPDFNKAISWAAETGITTGYSDNTFRPWNTCNRAAVVTFLWRFAGSPEPEVMAAFKDMTGNSDFDTAISWASENGITTGWDDNTFRPWNTCNRLAVVSFLYRYEENWLGQ